MLPSGGSVRAGDCRNLVRETVEQLGRVGILVNNAGVGTAVPALRETPDQFEHSAGKAGLIGLTRDLAQPWTGRRGIRVNAIAPGFFASEMTDQYAPEYVKAVGSRILAGRWGDERELAATVVFLAGPAASSITGRPCPWMGASRSHELGPSGVWFRALGGRMMEGR